MHYSKVFGLNKGFFFHIKNCLRFCAVLYMGQIDVQGEVGTDAQREGNIYGAALSLRSELYWRTVA